MDRQATARALAKVHAYLDQGDEDKAAIFAAMLVDDLLDRLPMARAHLRADSDRDDV